MERSSMNKLILLPRRTRRSELARSYICIEMARRRLGADQKTHDAARAIPAQLPVPAPARIHPRDGMEQRALTFSGSGR